MNLRIRSVKRIELSNYLALNRFLTKIKILELHRFQDDCDLDSLKCSCVYCHSESSHEDAHQNVSHLNEQDIPL